MKGLRRGSKVHLGDVGKESIDNPGREENEPYREGIKVIPKEKETKPLWERERIVQCVGQMGGKKKNSGGYG